MSRAATSARCSARSGRFPPPAAVALIGQVLDALACAHGLGIVHRDVKPANILLLADGRVKMTDFGISRLDTSALTQTGSVIGTPSYMSPEQCRGEPVDARSDLFSAGVVLYELLSGARPFTGRNMTEIALQVMNQPPPDIRADRSGPAAVAGRGGRARAGQAARGSLRHRRRDGGSAPAIAVQPAPDDAADRTVVVPRGHGHVHRGDAQHARTQTGPARRSDRTSSGADRGAARPVRSRNCSEIVAQRIDQPEQRSRFRQD